MESNMEVYEQLYEGIRILAIAELILSSATVAGFSIIAAVRRRGVARFLGYLYEVALAAGYIACLVQWPVEVNGPISFGLCSTLLICTFTAVIWPWCIEFPAIFHREANRPTGHPPLDKARARRFWRALALGTVFGMCECGLLLCWIYWNAIMTG